MIQLEKRKINALKYMEKQWNYTSASEHKKTIDETINLIKKSVNKNGIFVKFHGVELHFNCLKKSDLNIKWQFKRMDNRVNGKHYPKKNKIAFNSILHNDGPTAYDTIYHEITHHLQCKLIKYIDQYPKDSIEYQYLSLLKFEVLHKKIEGQLFGIKYSGESYIDSEKLCGVLGDIDLNEAFYALQLSERNAMSSGRKACEYLLSMCDDNEIVENYKSRNVYMQEHVADIIREEYCMKNITYSDICEIVDSAKENIIYSKIPKQNDLEAAITYHLANIINTQNTKDFIEAKDTYEKNKNNMKNALYFEYEEEGYSFSIPQSKERVGGYIFINDLYCLYDNDGIFTAKQLSTLSEEEQIRNPLLIVAAFFVDGESAKDVIKNVDAFKAWYHSESNTISEATMLLIADAMGPDYAPKTQKEINVIDEEKSVTHYETNNMCDDYFQDRFRYDEVEENFDDQEFIEPKGPGE